MLEIEKKKNICDLKYNTYLNYFNVFLVLYGTIIVTIWLSSNIDNFIKDFQVSLLFKACLTVSILIITIITWLYFDSKLNEIREQIKELI